ncbi:hypothetical protein [Nonomuraea sp. NPDC050643]|uniref:hypothetical protein n=1 Tax=Nonomuraea sp. NPDC050643 TaxID=3155660 RepID=UPI0033E13D77
MSQKRRRITCICCQQPGIHRGRQLIEPCYDRAWAHRTLDRFPLQPHATPWLPTGPHGRKMLARYTELVAERASRKRILWELGLETERSIQRYEAARRHLASQEASA